MPYGEKDHPKLTHNRVTAPSNYVLVASPLFCPSAEKNLLALASSGVLVRRFARLNRQCSGQTPLFPEGVRHLPRSFSSHPQRVSLNKTRDFM